MNSCVFPFFCRYELLQKQLIQLEEVEGGFDQFTRSYNTFGVQRRPDNSLFFKEWAPAAEALFLTGDFSKWTLHSLMRTVSSSTACQQCDVQVQVVSQSLQSFITTKLSSSLLCLKVLQFLQTVFNTDVNTLKLKFKVGTLTL